MEARSRVAAAAAAVVPFHCVICFDEFNLKERPPMVLPCGHTYVCLPCSKRLRRCMECREPLFIPVPNSGGPQHGHQQQHRPTTPNRFEGSGLYGNRGGSTFQRYGSGGPANSPPQQAPATPPHGSFNHYHNPPHHHHRPQQHPSPPATIPLPIPKNVVLISMIEAAERQAKVVEKEMKELEEFEEQVRGEQQAALEGEDEGRERLDPAAVAQEEEEDQFDLNRIISGMATLSGPCGTYAVREATGLTVIPTDPRKRMQAVKENDENDNNNTSEEKKQETSADDSFPDDENHHHMIEPYALEEGQTVQVVSYEDGVAKLARGAGFIIANSSQLVKVGGPLDETCRLEGLLETVEGRGNDLKRELETSHAIEENLKQQIHAAMELEPTHPIVSEAPKPVDTFLSASNSDSVDTPLPSTPPSTDKSHLDTPETADSAMMGFMIENRPNSNSLSAELLSFLPRHHGLPESPVSIDNADINLPCYRRSNSDVDLSSLAGLGCGTTFLGDASTIFGGGQAEIGFNDHRDDQHHEEEQDSVIGGASSIVSDGRARSDSHESSPGQVGSYSYYDVTTAGTPTQTASFDGVDFRTGLSGHRALNRCSTHRHYVPAPRHHGRMMMSEHRGVGRIRRLRSSHSPSFDPRFMPVQESTGSC